MKLQIWRPKQDNKHNSVIIDNTPTNQEEASNLFANPIDVQTQLNQVLLQERKQDMNERIIFADRAFFLTTIWVVFLVAFPLLQMWASVKEVDGLSDAQFVAVVTSTTASVFGFWYLVGRYLFPDKGNGKERDK